MPLKQGASKEVARENYKKLLKEGYPRYQAYAIVAQITRRNIDNVSPARQYQIKKGDILGKRKKLG